MVDNARAEALRQLAALGVKADPTAVAQEATAPTRTGEEVYAGGEVARILIRDAHLTYKEGTELLHAFAVPGDTVLLTAKQAKRLDDLEVTQDPDAEPEVAAEEPTVIGTTDEELEAMTAPQAIAHVNQHPEDRVRMRALEGKRDNPRVTVLKATAPEGEDEDGEEFDPEDDG